MDDDKFKKEVLNRLDKIAALLSILCAVSDGSLERPQAEAALRRVIGSKQANQTESYQYQINDEMQDIQAMQTSKGATANNPQQR